MRLFDYVFFFAIFFSGPLVLLFMDERPTPTTAAFWAAFATTTTLARIIRDELGKAPQ